MIRVVSGGLLFLTLFGYLNRWLAVAEYAVSFRHILSRLPLETMQIVALGKGRKSAIADVQLEMPH